MDSLSKSRHIFSKIAQFGDLTVEEKQGHYMLVVVAHSPIAEVLEKLFCSVYSGVLHVFRQTIRHATAFVKSDYDGLKRVSCKLLLDIF